MADRARQVRWDHGFHIGPHICAKRCALAYLSWPTQTFSEVLHLFLTFYGISFSFYLKENSTMYEILVQRKPEKRHGNCLSLFSHKSFQHVSANVRKSYSFCKISETSTCFAFIKPI